ncbi:MAG: hypothetical protein U1F83_01550 [Verrucomicrobiota bacterium]
MIGFLRFMGMLNAAIWLGSAIFCTLGILPVVNSQAMMGLLGQTYYPYLAGGIIRLIIVRLFYWQILFAVIAWLHLVLEWLYLGRTPRRLWVGLLTMLFSVSLITGLWLNPKLTRLHRSAHALNLKPEERAVAQKNFQFWDGIFEAVNVLLIGGVAGYFWRLTTTEDAPRFVTPVKFRG